MIKVKFKIQPDKVGALLNAFNGHEINLLPSTDTERIVVLKSNGGSKVHVQNLSDSLRKLIGNLDLLTPEEKQKVNGVYKSLINDGCILDTQSAFLKTIQPKCVGTYTLRLDEFEKCEKNLKELVNNFFEN
jgi:hypothetical protein